MTIPLLILLACLIFGLLWDKFPDDDDHTDYPNGYR